MEKIVELETSKFEDCKKKPSSFDQDSVKTGECFSEALVIVSYFQENLDEEVGFVLTRYYNVIVL